MINLKKIASHSFIYALGPQLPKLAGILTLPLVTPYLNTVDYGVWGTILAYTGALSAIKDLGLVLPLVNSFYQYPNKWRYKWRWILGCLMIWSFLFLILQSILLWYIIPKEAYDNKLLIIFLLGIPVILFDGTVLIGQRYFQLYQKPIYVAFVSTVSGFMTIFFTYILIVFFHKKYMGWFIATFLGLATQFVLYIWPVYFKAKLYPIFDLNLRRIKRVLKISLPLIPHNYSSYLLNASDRVVMSAYKVSIDKIGLYNVAYTWGNYVEMIGSAIGTATGPFYFSLFSQKNNESEARVKNLTYILEIFFITMCFVLSLWIKEIFLIFFKQNELRSAYPLAVIIIMSYTYFPMYWHVINKLQFNNLTSSLWKITTLGGIINIVLNLILMPFFGYKVATITTMISLLYISVAGFLLPEFKHKNKSNFSPTKWILLIVLLTIISYIFKDTSLLIKCTITILSLILSVRFIYKLQYGGYNV